MSAMRRGQWKTFEPPILVAVPLNQRLKSVSSVTEKNSIKIIPLGAGRYQVSEKDENGKRLCMIVSEPAKIEDYRLVTGCEIDEGDKEEFEEELMGAHVTGTLLNRMLSKAWPANT